MTPTCSFATRVRLDVDERRRRLQRLLDCTVPDLIDQALAALDEKIERDHQAA
jgi:hypothetical protein